ncbi:glycoside hydrolase family 36 protein [Oceanispirochaeta sp.]|jgi:alpha-galactosidase|uniref:glycoside hydrolase family 36 protein n=1 Tax=Oceanispirochaeta sp. TaxID=2035350 RepID=UPI0026222272|nr:glycoside hydrolase family 36 protein [Oceanispirochaeta sp.]MDA3957576.1 alpha-galactosidase [Oceanispirochaeta sp.]
MDIILEENGINLHIHITEEGDVRLYHLASWRPEIAPDLESGSKYRLVELHESGRNQNDHHGSKHTGSSPGSLLRYRSHQMERNEYGLLLSLIQEHEELWVTSFLQFFDGIPVVRSWTDLMNMGSLSRPIEYVSSLALTGLSGGAGRQRGDNTLISIPHNTWYGEVLWSRYTPAELGYHVVNDFSVKRMSCSNTGTWASGEYLPMGAYTNLTKGNTRLWQIETHGSWHWEISDIARELYLQLSGPTYQENGFFINLNPGKGFSSEKAALSMVQGGFEEAVQALTMYRRKIRRPNLDNQKPSVIFNDYMNCLSGDPTTEKLLPLIDVAADSGCKYFCIDAGWYDDGPWWEGVGEWLPSVKRFPGGIQEPLDRIRSLGMIPGLWLELEVMGIHCPLVRKVPKEWFFIRNGRPVIDEGRYQLDYRNHEVRAYADSIIKRLVEDYGVGYIKMDYNINAGIGTELYSDSPGDGLLQHTRAYLGWLDEVFLQYPELIIENCSSGGMRMTWSLLTRHSIQSVTDQTDYIKNAVIAVNCPTAVTPEQAAIWSYPLKDGNVEETIFNMVNAILLRIHMSGHIANLSRERLNVVQEGIEYHLGICDDISRGLPFWPVGLAHMDDEVISLGMDCGNTLYLAVWKLKGMKGSVSLPLVGLKDRAPSIRCSYPKGLSCKFMWYDATGILQVDLDPETARIFEITKQPS